MKFKLIKNNQKGFVAVFVLPIIVLTSYVLLQFVSAGWQQQKTLNHQKTTLFVRDSTETALQSLLFMHKLNSALPNKTLWQSLLNQHKIKVCLDKNGNFQTNCQAVYFDTILKISIIIDLTLRKTATGGLFIYTDNNNLNWFVADVKIQSSNKQTTHSKKAVFLVKKKLRVKFL